MSILIKNKAVPKTCEECLFYGIDVESGCFLEKCFVIRRVGQDKPSWCPLVHVPPHGRLIDADAVNAEIERNVRKYYNECGGGYYLAEEAQYEVQCAPTIIEAEEEQG